MSMFLKVGLLHIVCLLALATSVDAQSRGKIAGKVTDAGTGEPLPGVNVVIVGTTLGTATDVDGDYFIANLRPDTYSIRATFIGYQPTIVTDIVVGSGRTAEQNIELEVATLGLDEEIVITATRPLVEQDNTTSLIVIESEEITQRPTVVLTNLLTTLPSINVENGEMLVRGGALNEVAFLLDGTRVGNPLDYQPYTRINFSAIQELEVITGAFNAEYGEAQSGVVNVITKEGGENYQFYLDSRFSPPKVPHFGPSFYDLGTDVYWENAYARHLEWWIEYPDMWVDPNGIPGSDPRSIWSPEEAYQNYLDTHQPLTDYANDPTYQFEAGLGGPIPLVKNLTFFATGRFRKEPPVLGNSFRSEGKFVDGTLKLTYRLWDSGKLSFSGLYGREDTGWGYFLDNFWADNFGIDSRYAYYDLPGYSESSTDGQTLTYTHVVNSASMFEIAASRVHARRVKDIFPGDPIGWDAADATRDNLRAVDELGNPIPGGYSNRIGFHTLGYYDRHTNNNTALSLRGFYSNQLTKAFSLKVGGDVTGYRLDQYNQAKLPDRTDDDVYKPLQGDAYVQGKIEVGGFIMNAGLRFDLYKPNQDQFSSLFDPLNSETEPAKIHTQLSPRLGVSHPIDTRTVLHFSFGQFFQRPPFFDVGEGNDNVSGSLTTFVLDNTDTPWVLGNRNLNPEKTTAFEVGIERNFLDFFLIDVTGYYKDIRNTIRTVTIETADAIYRTNGNGDYADESGVELSLRKVPSAYSWGSVSGYANYTTRSSILGRSGDPVVVTPTGVRYAPSGDFIIPNNKRLKIGFYYSTPSAWSGLLGAIAKNISVSVDFRATFANDDVRQDFFLFEGVKYLRPPDTITDFRIRKDIFLGGPRGKISPYIEVTNLLNQKWLYLAAFERASIDEQRKFVESGFEYLPSVDANGRPILDITKYRNLPRQVVFGVSIEL